MENDIRKHINLVKNYKPLLNEAIKTECQTNGAIFHTKISNNEITTSIEIPFELKLTPKEAKLLENNIHNALELVLKPYFMKKN